MQFTDPPRDFSIPPPQIKRGARRPGVFSAPKSTAPQVPEAPWPISPKSRSRPGRAPLSRVLPYARSLAGRVWGDAPPAWRAGSRAADRAPRVTKPKFPHMEGPSDRSGREAENCFQGSIITTDPNAACTIPTTIDHRERPNSYPLWELSGPLGRRNGKRQRLQIERELFKCIPG